MNTEKTFSKIEKAAAKKNSKNIISLMKKADPEVLVKALEALGQIGDEDSCNTITHYLENPADQVRIAACKAGLCANSEYLRTRIRHQFANEQVESVRKEIQNALNEASK